MGSKSPPFRGGKRRSNRPKNNSNKKGSSNAPSKSTDIAPSNPQFPNVKDTIVNDDKPKSPKPTADMSKAVTPSTKNADHVPINDGKQPSSVNPGKSPLNDEKSPSIPQPDESFKNAILSEKTIEEPKSTFLLQKEIYENKQSQLDLNTLKKVDSEFCNYIRMTMMFKLPSKIRGLFR